MTDSIYHRATVKMTHRRNDLKGEAGVYLFQSGTVIIDFGAANNAMGLSFHTDADSLRAFAKLLNEAVEALPAKVEEAA